MERPRLVGSDKMNSPDAVAKVLKGWRVAVRGAEGQIVAKGEASRRISGGPCREELIEQTLISAYQINKSNAAI